MKTSTKRAANAGKHRATDGTARSVKDLAPKKPLKSGRSDPAGNTIYVGSANGGVWKTTY